ncbi:cytochrome b/b6 domain-containing protein [Rhizobiaceae bacterium]|nr:cytochrome b/b6 domain-containing protein [Rhizobiaceae bacterium]
MAMTEPNVPLPQRWTTLNITLHWTILALLLLQFIDSEWMPELFDQSRDGTASDLLTLVMGYGHMVIGALIFLAITVRLWDRRVHGRPAHSMSEPNWATTLAKVTHVALYAILLSMPLAGAAAWLTGSDWIAEVHGYAWTALMVFAALHITGALVNHFHFKNDVLRRMMPGQGRETN